MAQLEFRIGDTELVPLIADLEGLIALQLKAKSLHFSTDLCELCVSADPERLRQILLNLFTNAVKFTAPGGRVGISCERQDHMAHIKVWDTGIGIAPDQHARIFDPFVQLNRGPSNRTVDGVGLGLAISRNLARAMGGNLMVESGPSQGSRFLLTLPLALASSTH
ncbi:MAG: ATP-binding protein [Gemmatimonadaceae bacterium]|nr:ATP-binding protein [Gemmatimonadaceae bacterium]